MQVYIRSANAHDAERLFSWRNDPLTREMSKSQDIVSWDRHIAWLDARLSRDRPALFIAAIDSTPVGTLRIDNDEISYTVAPEHRSKGIATAMLTEARKCFGALRADIYSRNIASLRAATSAGHIVNELPD